MSALEIAVDAHDLAQHWRGIARYVHAVLARFARRDDVVVTRVERGPFGMRAPRRADVVWHPQNGTFFGSRAPAVVSFHDAVPFRFPASDPRRRRSQQGPWLRSAATASAFLVNSRFTAAEIAACLGVAPERETVSYLGVEHEIFHPHGEQRALPEGRPYVLFVGASEPWKNLATLLAAHAAAFGEAGPALVVAGGAAPPGARAHSLGVVTPEELASWYRGASLVAIPSIYEGFGLTLLEAMACGVPAVAARIGGLIEVGGDGCAWVDDPSDVPAWAQALQRGVEDEPLRERLRAAGPARAGAFSWDRCADETLAVLRRTAEGR